MKPIQQQSEYKHTDRSCRLTAFELEESIHESCLTNSEKRIETSSAVERLAVWFVSAPARFAQIVAAADCDELLEANQAGRRPTLAACAMTEM